MIHFIDPLARLGSRLLEVEKPARYTGGEFGRLAKTDALLYSAVVFPDLYELGMSNQAFRILYNGLNGIDGISCDRAFAPAPDFEKLLEEEGVSLYGLDTGIQLADTDMLLFTLGYELGISGVLSVLDHSRIALRSKDRSPADPIVIMGGPCVSNPLPYSPFIDAFWIGEAEAGFFELSRELLDMKKSAAFRADLLDHIRSHPHIWAPGKSSVQRAVAADFGRTPKPAAVFPVPSIRTVQHHGAVEIMRGCPNGCRFCHAGMWYRPMRQKRADLIMQEADDFVVNGGYREISLSSLSSGDYCHINELIEALNKRYQDRHISFQLPSLRVSGFSLPLLAKISEVRKSGLTFAIETPGDLDQLSINKRVSQAEVITIIREAKKYGWRGVKFYFMIGLPLKHLENKRPPAVPVFNEEKMIVDFILEAGKAAHTHFHINVGTFVPKPHTPYQWAAQLDVEGAWKKLNYIRDNLKPRGHKITVHNPFISLLEGVITRGNERVGDMLEEAYKTGCRLDAWSDYIRIDIWESIIEKYHELVQLILQGKKLTEDLPWEKAIKSGVGEAYLGREENRSLKGESTLPCIKNCTHRCGVCNEDRRIVINSIQPEVKTLGDTSKNTSNVTKQPDADTFRMLFSFSKKGNAVFIPHLGLVELFSMTVLRAGIPGLYTRGFNPLLKMEFASPAAIGLICLEEMASMDLAEKIPAGIFTESINGNLPEGFSIHRAELFTIPGGAKKHSLASLLWGFRYTKELIPAGEEKSFRLSLAENKNIFGIERTAVLAKDPGSKGPVDYFSLFRSYYSRQNLHYE